MRVLIVEDERKLGQVLASALHAEHYEVVVAPTGDEAVFRAKDELFDLVLLDLILPGRARIFDRFFRLDDSRTRDPGGAGLGLAIAKWGVEMHGGRIAVDDRPGGGAEFRIHLPVMRAE